MGPGVGIGVGAGVGTGVGSGVGKTVGIRDGTRVGPAEGACDMIAVVDGVSFKAFDSGVVTLTLSVYMKREMR